MFKENTKWFSVLLVICTLLGGLGGYGYGFIFNPKAPVTNFLMDINGNLDVNSIETNTARIDALTSGRIPIAGANGLLGDSSNLTFTGGNTLNVPNLNVTSSLYVNGYYSGSIPGYTIWNDTIAHLICARNEATGIITKSINCANLTNACISSLPNGGDLFYKSGIYTFTWVILLQDDIHIYGTKSTIFTVPSNIQVQLMRAIGKTGIRLDGFSVNGNSLNQNNANASNTYLENTDCQIKNIIYSHLYGTAISLTGTTVTNLRSVKDCQFYYMGEGISGGGIYTQGQNLDISHNQFNRATDNAIGLDNVKYVTVDDNIAINCSYLLIGSPANYTTITNNKIINCSMGIRLEWEGKYSNNNIVSNNIINQTTSSFGVRYLGNHLILSGNTINGATGLGVDIHATSKNINIANNEISNNKSGGITISGCLYSLINDNNIYDNGMTGSDWTYGIYLLNSSNSTITYNHSYNQLTSYQRSGLSVSGSSDYNTITGNQFYKGRVKDVDGISGTHNKIYKNIGYITEIEGSNSISNTTTSVKISYTASFTPLASDISITATSWPGNARLFYVTSITATDFYVNVYPSPGTGNTLTFNWAIDNKK